MASLWCHTLPGTGEGGEELNYPGGISLIIKGGASGAELQCTLQVILGELNISDCPPPDVQW